MLFKAVTIEDKEIFKSFYKGRCRMGSECSFANIYAWRQSYNTSFAIEDNFLFVRAKFDGYPAFYLMPVGSGNIVEAIEKIKNDAHEKGEKCIIKQLSKEDADFIKDTFKEFNIKENRDIAEYIYKTEKLINLSGKKLHSKRNHINKFLSTYEYSYEEITEKNKDEALKFILNTIGEGEGTEDERLSVLSFFDKFFELEQSGAVIRIGGEIKAATVGEMLNNNTAVIHIEKADTEIDGMYAAINQMFVKNRFSDTMYINREEDMGIEGLRKAKTSYYPDILYMKYLAEEI